MEGWEKTEPATRVVFMSPPLDKPGGCETKARGNEPLLSISLDVVHLPWRVEKESGPKPASHLPRQTDPQ